MLYFLFVVPALSFTCDWWHLSKKAKVNSQKSMYLSLINILEKNARIIIILELEKSKIDVIDAVLKYTAWGFMSTAPQLLRVCSHLHPFHFKLNSKRVEFWISPIALWGLVCYHTQTTNYEVDCWLPDVAPGESDIFLWSGRHNERQSQNKGIWITVFSGEAKLLCLPSSLGKNKTGTKV